MAHRPSSLCRALALGVVAVCSLLSGFGALDAGAAPRVKLDTGRAFARASFAAPRTHFRFFSPSSPWNTAVSRGAQLDPSSQRITRALAAETEAEQRAGDGPWISTSGYSVPIYTVPAGQPTVQVHLSGSSPSPALQAAFEAVPLPPVAAPASGTDGHLVVWQPSSDSLWEFWKLSRSAAGSQAAWGGAMRDVSSNTGVYGPEAWPGAEPWWGASASSLSIAGGLITLEDLRKGEINHALALAVPEVRAGVYASPAQRTDGRSTDPSALPEGSHLRLDPDLDIGAMHLPRVTRLIAEAAQRYGIYVRDGAGVTQFYAQEATGPGPNPYTGPGGLFEARYPNQLLASFPWERLQLLRMDLRRG